MSIAEIIWSTFVYTLSFEHATALNINLEWIMATLAKMRGQRLGEVEWLARGHSAGKL